MARKKRRISRSFLLSTPEPIVGAHQPFEGWCAFLNCEMYMCKRARRRVTTAMREGKGMEVCEFVLGSDMHPRPIGITFLYGF